MNIIDTIRDLSAIAGVSGDESRVCSAIANLIADDAELSVDNLGNLIAFKKGREVPKNKILFSAHMDEVGFIVTYIEDSGLLRFTSVGGIDSRVAVGKRVQVGESLATGIIGTKAVHMQKESEREEALPFDKLYIDIGAKSKEEAETMVSLGDRAVFCGTFTNLGDDFILSKALDDRAGCALLISMIKSELPYDTYFSFTVQEETGCTGAVAAGYTVNPDISIAIETTTASDIAGVAPDKVVCKLGNGPVVSYMDRGTIYDKELYKLAMETARASNIPVQTKEGVFGGNESRSLQVAKGGSRAMAVNLPCRYLHSPSCVLHKGDIENTESFLPILLNTIANI